jgi:hypothetical protein
MVAWHWQADGKHMSIGGQTRLWRSRAWLAFLAVLATPALASPVNVLECKSVSFSGPVPAVDVSSDFTVRRHVMPPVEWLETDFWTQGKFEDNGYFEVTVYPHEGEPFTERSGSTRTLVQDGFGDLGDVIVDEAPTMNSTHSIEGWTLESVVIVLRKADGTAITDSTVFGEVYERENWDPYPGCSQGGLCPMECGLTWKAPGEGFPCQDSGGGGTLCTHGTLIDRIDSLTYEAHEADHGAPFAINAGLNDAWVTSQAHYQGLFVTVYEDLGLVFVAWFTFEVPAQGGATTTQSLQSGLPAVFGAEDQRWVTAVGAYSGNHASLNLELTTGGLFNASEPVPSQDTDYGTLDLEFSDCSNGTVTFNVPAAGLSGNFPITRVLEENAALCETLSPQ